MNPNLIAAFVGFGIICALIACVLMYVFRDVFREMDNE